MSFLMRSLFLFIPFALNSVAYSQDLPDTKLSASQIQHIESGLPISTIAKAPNGQIDVFGVVDIKATPQTIWAIMQDCTQQLEIIPDLKACNILEQDLQKTWDKREQIIKLGFPLPNVRSEFRSDYTPFQSIQITRTGGDLSVLNGQWTLEPLSSPITRVSYRARMKSRLPIPRRFIRKAVRHDMPIILTNLKTLAEAQN